MPLRHPRLHVRVLTVFLITALPVLALGVLVVIANGQSQLRTAFGLQLSQKAEHTAAAIDGYVYRRVIDVSLLARLPQVRAAAEAGSRRPFDDRAEAALDRAWPARPPAVGRLLADPASKLLTDWVAYDPMYREILLTDRQGRLVAASNVSSDYLQGDEDWWQAAVGDGGRVTVSDVRWDESARVYALETSAPVTDVSGEHVTGVLKVVSDIREMLAAVAGVQLGGSGEAMLLRRDGSIVFSRRQVGPGARFFGNDALQDRLGATEPSAEPQPGVYFTASMPDGSRQLVGVASSQLGLSYPALSWLVAVWQPEDELLAPARSQAWQFVLVLVLTAIIVLAFALWFSMRLVAPPSGVSMELVEHARIHGLEEPEEPSRGAA